MPPNAFFPWTHDFLVSQKNDAKTLFSTLHPLSPVIFATATVVAFVLLCNSKFSFRCYTQCELMHTWKSAQNWQLRPLATSCVKDYKGHSLMQTGFTEPPNTHRVSVPFCMILIFVQLCVGQSSQNVLFQLVLKALQNLGGNCINSTISLARKGFALLL